MRIAQLIYLLDDGGAETLMRDLSRHLARAGHEVDIFLLDRWTHSSLEDASREMLRRDGVSIRSLGRRRGCPGLMPAAKLWAKIQLNRYDIVHSHLSIPNVVAGFLDRVGPHRFRHVVTVHNTLKRLGFTRKKSLYVRTSNAGAT